MNTYIVTYKYLDEDTGKWKSEESSIVASDVAAAITHVEGAFDVCVIESVVLNDPYKDSTKKNSDSTLAEIFMSLFLDSDCPEFHIGEIELDNLLDMMGKLECATNSVNHSGMVGARVFSDRTGTVEMDDKSLFDFKLK